VWRIILWLTMLALIASCFQSDNPAENRARRAAKAKGNILVGAAGPWVTLDRMLWQGIQLAAEEIDANGGILGRQLQIVKEDDQGSVREGQIVAERLAKNPDMVAVLGHVDSYVSVSTSILYEYFGILMLSPTSTSTKLTNQGLRRVFRIVPETEAFAKTLAELCEVQGFRAMMIYNEDMDVAKDLANQFDDEADARGIDILDRLTYEATSGPKIFKKDLRYWKEMFTFDAIFLSGTLPEAALFIEEARKQGIMVPIVSGDGIDAPRLLELVSPEEDSIFVATTFRSIDDRQEVQAFVKDFSEKYGSPPDTAAALGYDALKILAAAMEKAGTTVPDKIAETLRTSQGWPGVTGIHIFDAHGNVMGPEIRINRVANGRFQHFLF